MNVQRSIGLTMPPFVFEIERFQLRLFAQAVGETRSIYLDVDAAQAAGFRDLPALPTFAFTIGMPPQAPFDLLEALELDLRGVLHGEQSFTYFRPMCAGDRVRVHRKVVEAYERKGGALQFFVVEMRLEPEAGGELFCMARQTIVMRALGDQQ